MLDYYKILQVGENAEPEVIEAAYKKLIFKYHPDRNPDPNAKRTTQLLIEAFGTLSNPQARVEHDLALAEERRQQGNRADPDTSKTASPTSAPPRYDRPMHTIPEQETAQPPPSDNSPWQGTPSAADYFVAWTNYLFNRAPSCSLVFWASVVAAIVLALWLIRHNAPNR